MRSSKKVLSVVFTVAIIFYVVQVFAVDGTWSGAGDNDWYGNTTNWVDGIVPTSYSGWAFFPDVGGDATMTTRTMIGNRTHVTPSAMIFTNASHNYTMNSYSSRRYEPGLVRVCSNFYGNVTFNSTITKKGTFTAQNYGTGLLKTGTVNIENGGTINFTTVAAPGRIEIGSVNAFDGRMIYYKKSGTNVVSFGNFDCKIDTTRLGNIVVQEGPLDVSGTTLKFEKLSGAGTPVVGVDVTESQYTLLDYSAGSIIPASSTEVFADVVQLPEGYAIVHDEANKVVYLQKLPAGTILIID